MIEKIESLLIQKKIKAGDRLPSETILSETLGISRNSVREAFKILSANGVIESRRGDGTYITPPGNRFKFDALRFSLLVSDADKKEIIEFRKIIEFDVIELIVANARSDDINKIEAAFLAQKEVQKSGRLDPQAESAFDLEFHRRMAEATGNKLIEIVYKFIIDFLAPSIAMTQARLHETHPDFSTIKDTHAMILDAIKRRDVAAAHQSILEAVSVWQENI